MAFLRFFKFFAQLQRMAEDRIDLSIIWLHGEVAILCTAFLFFLLCKPPDKNLRFDTLIFKVMHRRPGKMPIFWELSNLRKIDCFFPKFRQNSQKKLFLRQFWCRKISFGHVSRNQFSFTKTDFNPPKLIFILRCQFWYPVVYLSSCKLMFSFPNCYLIPKTSLYHSRMIFFLHIFIASAEIDLLVPKTG